MRKFEPEPADDEGPPVVGVVLMLVGIMVFFYGALLWAIWR